MMEPAGRIALRIEQDTPCPECGYNLRGMRLDARCPECGRATIDTFARPLGAGEGASAERALGRPAAGAMGLALVGYGHDAMTLAGAGPTGDALLLGAAAWLAATLLGLAGLAFGGARATRLVRQLGHGNATNAATAAMVCGAAVLLAASAVPVVNWTLAAVAVAGGAAGLVTMLGAWRVLVNRLREAQGSLASLGRARRATRSRERPFAKR